MEIHIRSDDHWSKSGETLVSGNAFIDGEHVSREEFAARISDADGKAGLLSILSRANGFFSVIHREGDTVYAAVDHVRSWPLYYANTDEVYVSDSSEWVHKSGGQNGYDPTATDEYIFTCYVTGSDTLSNDVKQIQAGELVIFREGNAESSINKEQYYCYDPGRNVEPASAETFEERLVEVFKRLIRYADGRTILLGLSSGYDSRLMALMLRRLGYDDTVTYTTLTASGSREKMRIAESIAEKLNFEHIEITSEKSDFQQLQTADQSSLIHDVGFLSEYPHLYKFVLRRKLEEAGVEVEDVVHVLGHQLMSAGESLSGQIREQDGISRGQFLDLMWNRHYANWIAQGDTDFRRLFEGRILDRVPGALYEHGNFESTMDAVRGYEQWYWRERLPKYILARREYEYLGFDMWYPLLDRRLCSFYERTRYQDKIERRILENYVDELHVRIVGESEEFDPRGTGESFRERTWSSATRLIHSLPDSLMDYIRKTYYDQRDIDWYEQDPRYGIISKEEFESMSFYTIRPRTLLLLYLYQRGFWDVPVQNEFDRALQG
ncbi:hypothetical protein [Halobellus litoreus]|uniref:Asparagine synthase (Glutamine-hydrolysing) n=1 Tax=Halobellus litoreus TaxID=755310 RepID=A0ABD6DV58_9EURY|nr:hypothetical protein [Halobellus litoreus]